MLNVYPLCQPAITFSPFSVFILFDVTELPSKPSIYDGSQNGALKIMMKTSLLRINETLDLKCESNGGEQNETNKQTEHQNTNCKRGLIDIQTFF